MNVVGAGRTLYIRDRAAGAHLWIVLSDPQPPRDEVALVMLVTRRSHTDETVVLGPGDHPFIRHETSVSYKTLRFESVHRLLALMAQSRCELREDLDAAALARVRAGVFESAHTVHAHRDRCAELFG